MDAQPFTCINPEGLQETLFVMIPFKLEWWKRTFHKWHLSQSAPSAWEMANDFTLQAFKIKCTCGKFQAGRKIQSLKKWFVFYICKHKGFIYFHCHKENELLYFFKQSQPAHFGNVLISKILTGKLVFK